MSIAKISSSVEGNFRLNQSAILPLLKKMFKFNEEHKEILRTSGWASSIDQASEIVNKDSLLRILTQNSCSLKQNIALNGLFGLAFLLLKTKASPELNKFAIEFLNEIIRTRQEFTSDIMKIVVKMLFCEKNKIPIVQCISTLLNNRHLDINSAKSALIQLIEDLTELDIETAVAIESAIFSAISKSIDLRDQMIEIMKNAMYQKDLEVRKMAIFSFCLMLRKFTKPPRLSAIHHNPNESRFAHNISFFSLTQSQIPINNINSNVRQGKPFFKCF
jgi:Fanconi anemia group I protein